jgi:hypothetical protein
MGYRRLITTSAVRGAGAALMPSPMKPILCCRDSSVLMILCVCDGETLANSVVFGKTSGRRSVDRTAEKGRCSSSIAADESSPLKNCRPQLRKKTSILPGFLSMRNLIEALHAGHNGQQLANPCTPVTAGGLVHIVSIRVSCRTIGAASVCREFQSEDGYH